MLTPVVNVGSRAIAIPADVRPADAIVVLGAGMRGDGELSSESLERFFYGVVLYKRGLAPILIVSGPPQGGSRAEASVRADLAVALGIPAAAIGQMPDVNTTRDEAYRCAELLSASGHKHVLLVTEPLHIRRATRVFEAAGLRVSPAPSDNFALNAAAPMERLYAFKSLAVQVAALIYYRMSGFI
jgi:uncharacterized SAM-binding protein YcdF (DUF218 family)